MILADLGTEQQKGQAVLALGRGYGLALQWGRFGGDSSTMALRVCLPQPPLLTP